MKKILLTTMFTAFAVSAASAIKIPKGIFRVKEAKEARTAAAEKEVAVAYIMFSEGIQPSWPTCSGTVSSTAIKELKSMKSYAKVVFVDQKEVNSLPTKVSQAINSAGGGMPLLVFMSPDNETNLGSFNHGTLKNQDYGKIFRDTKKKIRTAKKEGGFKNSGIVDSASNEKEEVVESSGVVISSPRLRSWKSSDGRMIKAKLIKFEDETYHLKTSKGKDVKVKAADLDAATVEMAKEIVNINSK